ncbi:unnamed protein product [Adineta ricciae]|uniref:Uncharacterized protein n=1 Tax=Adineta ricciae TaxID=249248 RepID=A0A815KFM2_ADIRI|nr:unnamed protein product [Adineta ricciae]CAF1392609.1 unnamed protein product [Adineta ricciae]
MAQPWCVTGLHSRDIAKYKTELDNNTAWLGFTKESFDISYTVTRGIQDKDMPAIIQKTDELVLKDVLKEVMLIGDGEIKINQSDVFQNGQYRKYLVFYYRRSDNLYDLVRVYATQKVEIKTAKLITLGLASAVSGAIAGALIAGPLGAAVGGVAGAGANTLKATYDYTTVSNVLSGYMLGELQRSNVVKITKDNTVEMVV